jgi:hypothetical protein
MTETATKDELDLLFEEQKKQQYERQALELEENKGNTEVLNRIKKKHLVQSNYLQIFQSRIRDKFKLSQDGKRDKSNDNSKQGNSNDNGEKGKSKDTNLYEFSIKLKQSEGGVSGTYTIGQNVFYDITSKTFLFFSDVSKLKKMDKTEYDKLNSVAIDDFKTNQTEPIQNGDQEYTIGSTAFYDKRTGLVWLFDKKFSLKIPAKDF